MEYRKLLNPTEAQLNELAEQGWRIVSVVVDARDGMIIVFMERERGVSYATKRK